MKGDNPKKNIITSKVVKLISIEPLVVETQSVTHYKLENIDSDIIKRIPEEEYKQKFIKHFSTQPLERFSI